MAHTCPNCGMTCHCGGDIDDICFGEADEFCSHCECGDYDFFEEEPEIDPDQEAEDNNPNDSRNL